MPDSPGWRSRISLRKANVSGPKAKDGGPADAGIGAEGEVAQAVVKNSAPSRSTPTRRPVTGEELR
jgi:hypothetical protein